MPSSPYSGSRAGFWRRTLAFTLDCILVGAVMTIVGPLTFSFTDGRVQVGGVGLQSESCVGTTSVPANLNPPPLEGSNHASICAAGTLPFVVSKRYLLVGRQTVSPGSVRDESRSYLLSASGVPIGAIDVTWIAQLGFLTYIAVSLVFNGRTVGMRLLRIRLAVPPFEAGHVGVPLSRLLIRVCVAAAGFVPAVLAAIWLLFLPDSANVTALIVAVLASLAWGGYNLSLIARKEDPVYDQVAGLAVLVDGHLSGL